MDSFIKIYFSFLIIIITPFSLSAESTKQAIKEAEAVINQSANHQSRVDKLEDSRQAALIQYRSHLLEIDSLTKNIEQYENSVKGQKKELAALKQQSERIEELKANLYPLLKEQVLALKKFINLDIPFLIKEREKRIETLEDALGRSDISDAEKYRMIAEAYEIEVEYGRSLQSYRDKAPESSLLNGDKNAVDYLRVGRLGWYFRTIDKKNIFAFDRVKKEWMKLPDSINDNFESLFSVARNEQLPQYLQIPEL